MNICSKAWQSDHKMLGQVFYCLQKGCAFSSFFLLIVMITYNIYIVIRETGQFSSKGIINDFIGNLNRLTVSRRFTEQAV